MKALVVVNPVAGQGRPLKVLPKVRAQFQKSDWEVDIFRTKFFVRFLPPVRIWFPNLSSLM